MMTKDRSVFQNGVEIKDIIAIDMVDLKKLQSGVFDLEMRF